MNIEAVIEKCKALKLKAIAEHLEQTTVLAGHRNWTPLQMIDHLFELELQLRKKNRIERCFKQSKLYEKTTIDQFDFSFHGSRKNQKSRIVNLMDLEFIKHRKDIILIGNPGVGKSFLAKCMAYAATQAGVKVLFTTAMDMINHLIAAEADHSMLKKNSNTINLRNSLSSMRSGIFPWAHRDQIYSSRSSVQGMKESQPS